MAYQASLSTRIKRAVEYHRLRFKFMGEKLLGHEFVPQRNRITIEPSGHCNLGCKFCAYRKKELGHVVMPNDDFASYIDQATELDFNVFSLTSSSGEIFFDKDIKWKFDYLENHPGVHSYEFYTNLILPDEDMLEFVFKLQKLNWIGISIYGHDAESFVRVTGKPKKQYDMLVKNLNFIADHPGVGKDFLELHLRAERSFTWNPDDGIDETASALTKAMYRAVTEGGVKWLENFMLYDNWGGMVTEEDVADLDIELSDGELQPKYGACTLLFDEPMIFADGVVNACACRGVDRSLQIGELKKAPLKDLLSAKNDTYHDIIHRHQNNDFPDACKDCTVYRSVYRKPRGWAYTSLAEFFQKHKDRAAEK